jgi:flavin-dependent thymidylate synthase
VGRKARLGGWLPNQISKEADVKILPGVKEAVVENSVKLIGVYGNDETHALSAWTSTSRELTDSKRARMDKLLNMLAKEGHHTPFEKSSLHFLITSDIASHIHMLKHRVGVSINTESARYKEFKEDKYYIPSDWPVAQQCALRAHLEASYLRYHSCLERLERLGVSRKRAKESARFYLPYGIQVTYDVMFNWRSFAHFQKLRNDEHAQVEIRTIAEKMLTLVGVEGSFPLTIKAMELAGMIPVRSS